MAQPLYYIVAVITPLDFVSSVQVSRFMFKISLSPYQTNIDFTVTDPTCLGIHLEPETLHPRRQWRSNR